MTDYNDGDWHGWNGGECPVHPKSRVTALESNGARWTAEAEDCDWPSMRGAFRVTKAYCEPRVFWLNEFPLGGMGCLHSTRREADICAADRIACHRVVIE